MELHAIAYDVTDDGVGTITLDRPHRHNAWTGRMHTEYRWALDQAEQDGNVGAIVVTGRGDSFCPGADSAALEGHVDKGGYDNGIRTVLARPGFGVRPEYDQAFAFHFGLTKPVIAAINGAVAGVGLALVCFCDVRFAREGAKFTTAHGRLNLPAEYGLSWLLPRIVGLGRANDLLLTSRVFLADEAERIGLVNAVHSAERLADEAHSYAANLASNVAPRSLRETKKQVYADLHRDIGASVIESEELLEVMMREPDFVEGVRALTERRPPRFSGNDVPGT